MDQPNPRCTRKSKTNQDSQKNPEKIVENCSVTKSDQKEKIIGNLKKISKLAYPHTKSEQEH